MRLADVAEGRNNNFTLMRFLAASGVLVSHAYPIALGPAAIQPLEETLGLTLGHVSVMVFFAISGLLITQSFVRSSSVQRWFAARVLRIFPALAVVLVLTVLVLGPLVSRLDLQSYLGAPGTQSYFPSNMSLYKLQYWLPGVFADNPLPATINGSLWTLKHEVSCYAAIGAIGLLGALRSARIATLLLAILAGMAAFVIVLEDSGLVHPFFVLFAKLGLPFALGALMFVLRNRISLRLPYVCLLIAAAALARPLAIHEVVFAVALTYAVFYLAYIPGGAVRHFNRLGDYSYGIYIYAFPMQQLAVHLWPGMSPLQNMAVAFPVTLLCGMLSWVMIEKPALGFKTRFGRRRDTADRPAARQPAPQRIRS